MSKQERDYSPGWRLFTKIILPPLIHSAMKCDFSGKENLAGDGGMILAGNHLSYADWAAMAIFSYEGGHYPVFTIKSPVFDVKIIGPLLRTLGQLPVYRGRSDAALLLKDAERRLGRGACVIFYPEGTASRDPEQWPMVARTGVARLALTTGVPVVPVACWGAQVILPYGDKRPKLFPRKTVKVTAGPPVDLSAFRDQPLTAQTLRGATEAIMADITKLLARLRGEEPPAAPYDPRAKRAVSGETSTGEADSVQPDTSETDAAPADTGEASTGEASTGETGQDGGAAGTTPKAQRG
ncbi:MAG TPA: lysophospholipid acyltransferase family protein [Streptosporangiaceae bacterium]